MKQAAYLFWLFCLTPFCNSQTKIDNLKEGEFLEITLIKDDGATQINYGKVIEKCSFKTDKEGVLEEGLVLECYYCFLSDNPNEISAFLDSKKSHASEFYKKLTVFSPNPIQMFIGENSFQGKPAKLRSIRKWKDGYPEYPK